MENAGYYVEYSRHERMLIKKEIGDSLKRGEFELSELAITDDGYVVDAVVVIGNDKMVSVEELCMRVDGLEFQNYMIVDIVFSVSKVNLVLVPITADAMNKFIWNYVMCYFPFVDELKSLLLAVSVLEHIVEPLSKEVKKEFDSLVTMLIQ